MKSAIPWILIVALLAGVFFLYSANKDKDAQLAKLSQDSADLDSLRKENEDLKKQSVSPDEVARLRKDNEEVLRLRNEVQTMRGQMKQLSTQLAAVQAQSSQVQQQAAKLASENDAKNSQLEQLRAEQQKTDACLNNLRQIDGAKQQWALENKKAMTDVPTAEDLAPYLPKNAALVCPSGGTYSINAMTQLPTCTVAGHELK